MFIDCLPWFSCLSCNAASSEADKVYGLSFKLLGLSPELGQRVHFAEGTNLRCREDKKPSSDDSEEERLAIRENRRFSSDDPRVILVRSETRKCGCEWQL